MISNFAIVIPMANEEKDFNNFITEIKKTLSFLGCGKVYLVVDNASIDNTKGICEELCNIDDRFELIWSPNNKNVVDAYLKGYSVALSNGHDFIIEMDAGMSHDPRAIPLFLRVLYEGNDCAFGSRFINGGSIQDSSWRRTYLSKVGTFVSNLLLGTHFYDMTSGFQGFHKSVVESFLKIKLHSKAHFYQTELRYLLRKKKYIEVPIHYRAPSPSVSRKAIFNSISVLMFYFFSRLTLRNKIIK